MEAFFNATPAWSCAIIPPMPPAGGPAGPLPATAAVLRSCLLTFFSPPALKPWMLSRRAELAAGFAVDVLSVAVGGGGASGGGGGGGGGCGGGDDAEASELLMIGGGASAGGASCGGANAGGAGCGGANAGGAGCWSALEWLLGWLGRSVGGGGESALRGADSTTTVPVPRPVETPPVLLRRETPASCAIMLPPVGAAVPDDGRAEALLRSLTAAFFSLLALKPWMLSRSAELAAGFAGLSVAVGGGGGASEGGGGGGGGGVDAANALESIGGG